jgi:pyridoxal phosphate enzyme (YggS family)
MILDKEILRESLDKVIFNIESARLSVDAHRIVEIVAVSKYTDIENIKTLYALGQRAFGENQVQQLKSRVQELEDLPLSWHMIGSLQKNKINNLIDINPILFQGLDSIELAQELDKKLKAKDKTMDVLLQINSANEESKSGVKSDEAIDIYQEIQERFSSIKLQGVMSIGAHSDDTKIIQKSFEDTYSIFDKLQKDGATVCSMGMSGDYEIAIKCGSNMVRVGSTILPRG